MWRIFTMPPHIAAVYTDAEKEAKKKEKAHKKAMREAFEAKQAERFWQDVKEAEQANGSAKDIAWQRVYDNVKTVNDLCCIISKHPIPCTFSAVSKAVDLLTTVSESDLMGSKQNTTRKVMNTAEKLLDVTMPLEGVIMKDTIKTAYSLLKAAQPKPRKQKSSTSTCKHDRYDRAGPGDRVVMAYDKERNPYRYIS